MTVSPTRPPTSPAAIPHPRAAEPELPAAEVASTRDIREPRTVHSPWPEPWRAVGATRPRTEYWDVATASWRSGHPVPRPRSED